MKRKILISLAVIVLIMISLIIGFIYSPKGYKFRMAFAIEIEEYEYAVEMMSHVKDWSYSGLWIDVDKGLACKKIADSIATKPLADSLYLYIGKECFFNGKGAYYIDCNYHEAISLLKLASEIYQSVLGQHNLNYINSLDYLGELYDAIADYVQAEHYCKQSIETTKLVFGEQNVNYALRYGNLGVLYGKMGEYNKAMQYLLQSLNIIESVIGEHSIEYADALSNLGTLYSETGNYLKAESCYLQSLNITKSILGEHHLVYAMRLGNIGIIYKTLGNLEKAENNLLKSAAITKSIVGESHYSYAVCLNNLSVFYSEYGNYEKAELYILQAAEILRNVVGENHPDYAKLLISIGVIYYSMGDYEKAEKYQLQSLTIHKSIFGERHPCYAVALQNLASLYQEKEDYEKAKAYYNRALEIQKDIIGVHHIDYATTLRGLGITYCYTCDYSQAEVTLLQALEVIGNNVGENNLHYFSAHLDLCYLYLKMNDYIKAEKYLLQGLDILGKVIGLDGGYYARIYDQLGFLYSKKGDFLKAENFYSRAQRINRHRFLQSLNFMSEKQRAFYWNTIKNLYEINYPSFAYRCNTSKPNISSFAYNNELFTKGVLLSASDNIKRSILESHDTILINKWNDLVMKRQQITKNEELNLQDCDSDDLRVDVERLEKEITHSSAIFRQSKEQWNITWDSVRNNLGNDQVAIEYMVAPLSKDSNMYCALLLRNNSKYPEMIPLFEEKEVATLVNTTSENQTSFMYSYGGNGQALQKLVWSKIIPHVKPSGTIYFAPSGILHQLAIEALPYDETHTMADMFNLVRLSSTREIVLNKTAAQHSSATLYGGIQYNMSNDELLAESEQYAASNLLVSRGIEDDALDRGSVKYLPGTKKEVENINRMLHDNNLSVKLYTSTTANEESFKALSGKHQNILHIATHGFYWADSTAQKKDYFSQRMLMMDDQAPTPPTIDPLNRCGLLFAGANTALSGHSADLPDGVQDGILTAKEISLLDLRDADLVVLSACETGKGEITGEGVFGLQRAFKQAGAQTIIMSLWPVNDAATQLLMTEFYRNWITNHQSKREAFRNAQNTVRSQYEEPVYWAGFIMLD